MTITTQKNRTINLEPSLTNPDMKQCDYCGMYSDMPMIYVGLYKFCSSKCAADKQAEVDAEEEFLNGD
jgi:hypothetical protein